MSRIAKWRKGPGDPGTARGWLFRGERSLESSPPFDWQSLLLPLGLALGWLATGALLLFVVPKGRYGLPFLSLFWPIFMTWNNRRSKRLSNEKRPELEESFEVTLAICSKHGLGTGRDRGLLIFCGGWLLFEGRRTELAVTRGEATGRLESSCLRLSLEDGRVAVLTAREGTGGEALKRAYYLWHATTPPDGEAVLPPVEIHPEIWAGYWAVCVAGMCVFVLIATLVALNGLWMLTIPFVLGLAVSLGGAFYYASRLRIELTHVLPNPGPPLKARETPTASLQ